MIHAFFNFVASAILMVLTYIHGDYAFTMVFASICIFTVLVESL